MPSIIFSEVSDRGDGVDAVLSWASHPIVPNIGVIERAVDKGQRSVDGHEQHSESAELEVGHPDM
jgi:hypothetical protein